MSKLRDQMSMYRDTLRVVSVKDIAQEVGRVALPDKKDWVVSSSITAVSMLLEAVVSPESSLLSVLKTGAITLAASSVATAGVNVVSSSDGRDCVRELWSRVWGNK